MSFARILGPRAVALLVVALCCASCADAYLARRDTLTLSSGDAVSRNVAVHTIDPWPKVAERTDDIVSGERLQRAVERYRNPASRQGGFGGGFDPGAAGAVPVVPPPALR